MDFPLVGVVTVGVKDSAEAVVTTRKALAAGVSADKVDTLEEVKVAGLGEVDSAVVAGAMIKKDLAVAALEAREDMVGATLAGVEVVSTREDLAVGEDMGDNSVG